MRVAWEADRWLTVRDIRDRMDYTPVGYTTVARVADILYKKGLLVRRLAAREGKPGPLAWWYRAARPASEHIGALIATLLDHSPHPQATLDYVLATRRTQPKAPSRRTSIPGPNRCISRRASAVSYPLASMPRNV